MQSRLQRDKNRCTASVMCIECDAKLIHSLVFVGGSCIDVLRVLSTTFQKPRRATLSPERCIIIPDTPSKESESLFAQLKLLLLPLRGLLESSTSVGDPAPVKTRAR